MTNGNGADNDNEVEADLSLTAVRCTNSFLKMAVQWQDWTREPMPAGANPIEWEQRRRQNMLASLAIFCDRWKLGNDVAEIFGGIATAFHDVQKGRNPQIFSRKKIPGGGRLPDTTEIWMVRAIAVCGLECLISGNLVDDMAAQRAGVKFPELKCLRTRTDKHRTKGPSRNRTKPRKGGDVAALLLSWRKILRKNGEPLKNDTVQSSFDRAIAEVEQWLATSAAADRIERGYKILGWAAMQARQIHSISNAPG
jgi:hypothetical protein